jgi:hypothetical protein
VPGVIVTPSDTHVAVGVPPRATVPGIWHPGVCCLVVARLLHSVVPEGALVVNRREPGTTPGFVVMVATPCSAMQHREVNETKRISRSELVWVQLVLK